MKRRNKAVLVFIGGIVGIIVAFYLILSLVSAVAQKQSVGQIGIWTNRFTNKFVKETDSAGIHNFNFTRKVEFYDVKNNTVKFSSSTDDTKTKGTSTNSPSITFQNKEGVSGEAELSVTYSIENSKVKGIWEGWGSQEAFNDNVVVQNIRSSVRNSFTDFTSLETYNERGEIEKNITDTLTKGLAEKGVVVTNVSLQNINYAQEIVDSFNTYQQKAVEIENAKAEKEKALIDAEKKVEVAAKEAEANKIKSESLTDKILQEKYIDAIKNSENRVIITDGSTNSLINVDGSEGK